MWRYSTSLIIREIQMKTIMRYHLTSVRMAVPKQQVWVRTWRKGNSSTLWQRRQWHPTPVLLPRKPHGWRSLVGCSPWGTKSQTRLSDFTFTFHFHALEKEMATHSGILAWRNPGVEEPGGLSSMGVAQGWTRLKRLSSSSSNIHSWGRPWWLRW